MRHKIQQLKNSIRDWIFPKNRWVSRCLPNHWVDKDTVIETVLFECVIQFVEKEKCFEATDWEASGNALEAAVIKEIYEYAKHERKKLEAQLDAAYPELGEFDDMIKRVNSGNYHELYGEVERIEKLIHETDTKYLAWIVEHRAYLWT